jgi:phenylalanyl-tRNA synthetase alpha chain
LAESCAERAKREVGQRVNELKTKVEQAVDATLARIQRGASSGKLAAERLDITLPGIRRPIGAEHPVIKTMNEIDRRLPQSGLLGRRRPGD